MYKPLFFESPGSNTIVVFIHGFMGSPRQFDSLIEAVRRRGYAAASLLLPGHGGTAREFSSGTMDSWLGHVRAETERYSRDFESVYLAGHSMGGLMAINAAVECGERVRSILLIACPFVLGRVSAHSLKVRMMQALYRKTHPMKEAYLTGTSVRLSPSLIWHSSKPASELRKLMRFTTDKLPDVRVPVTAVYSQSDELVPTANFDILKAGLHQAELETVLLSDSLHAYYPEHERVVIERALLRSMGENS